MCLKYSNFSSCHNAISYIYLKMHKAVIGLLLQTVELLNAIPK
jgi:hypothetical protein